MKYNVVNSDACTFPAYRPKRKFSYWGAIAAGIGGLFGLAGQENNSRITKEQMQLQHRMNKDEMNHSMQLQKSQQEWMLNNMYGKNVSGMMNAGLNPATANGVSPATPSGGSPSSGTSGPSATNSNLGSDMASAFVQGENLKADLEVKKEQANLLREQANDQRFRNSEIYRYLTLRGMSENVALTVARAAETNSNVDVNKQKIAESITSQQKMLSDIGVNQEQRQVLAQSCVESQYRCAEILQGIKESEARIMLHRACAYAQKAAAANSYAQANLAGEKAKTEESVRRLNDANADLAKSGKKLNEQHELESGYRTKQLELNNVVSAYWADVVTAVDPADRAKLMVAKDLEDIFMPILNSSSGSSTDAAVRVVVSGAKR